MVHLRTILLMVYLDDWLVQVVSFQLDLQQFQTMLQLCSELSLFVNLEKSDLIPSQNFKFIGARFDLIQCRIFSCRSQQVEGHPTDFDIYSQQQTFGQEVVVTSGHSGLSRQICLVREVSCQTSPMISGTCVGSEVRVSRQTDICSSSH